MIAAAGSDPTLAVHGWVATLLVLGGIASAFVAFAAFIAKVVLPLATTVAEIKRDYPVWAQIAEKFGSAGGETISAELRALASNDEVTVANQKAMMAQLETVIAQTKTLDIKLSETRHKIIGEFANLGASAAGAKTLVEAIVRTSEDLQAVRSELQQTQLQLQQMQQPGQQ